jgi:ABC-2 type transport system ATP-binding protein
VKIQECLREYNRTRGVTMLLTSHYMRDVEALCSRVLVITHGRIVYDGPLARITEELGQAKLVKLHFADAAPAGLERYGEVTSRNGPVADLKVERGRVPEVLSAILDRHTIIDMSVQDPPLDQMIARVFEGALHNEQANHEHGS